MLWTSIAALYLLISVPRHVTCSNCTGYLDSTSGICYKHFRIPQTSGKAVQHCSDLGGQVITVTSPKVQSIMEVLLHKNQIYTTWLGAWEHHTKWAWLSSGQEISAQGCYKDVMVARDMDIQVALTSTLTPEACLDKCRTLGYTYAGLQNGVECHCSHEFGSYGTAEKCHVPCPKPARISNISKWCGGTFANSVYKLDGAYGEWGFVEPNNKDNYQRCATVDVTVNWKLADEQCHKTYGYICDIPLNKCLASLSPTGKTINLSSGYLRYADLAADFCYYVSSDKLNFDFAKSTCKQRDGSLLELSSREDLLRMKKVLDYVDRHTGQMHSQYWLGLTRGAWTWLNGEPMSYTHWSSNKPWRDNNDCRHFAYASVQSNPQWAWQDADCHHTHPYICQIGPNIVPPTLTTKEPSTTPTSTTLTSVTPISDTPTSVTKSSTSPTKLALTSVGTSIGSGTSSKDYTSGVTKGGVDVTSISRVTTPTAKKTTTASRDTTPRRNSQTTTSINEMTTSAHNGSTFSGPVLAGSSSKKVWLGLSTVELVIIIFVIILSLLILILLFVYCCCCGGRVVALYTSKVTPVCLDARPLARHAANVYRGDDLYTASPHSAYFENLPFGDQIDVAPIICMHDTHKKGLPKEANYYHGDYTEYNSSPKIKRKLDMEFYN